MKTGDKILVRRKIEEWIERIFLFEREGKFHCASNSYEGDYFSGDSYMVFIWDEAKEITQPQYRPYTMKEFIDVYSNRGQPLSSGIQILNGISEGGVVIDSIFVDYKELLENIKWPNGDIMGVEVTE